MSVNGPQTPMGGSQQEGVAPAAYAPDQSQYVPPLQSWPPAAAQVEMATRAHKPPGDGRLVPWVFIGVGLIFPISALIVGIWATLSAFEDIRNAVIAVVAFAVFALPFLL